MVVNTKELADLICKTIIKNGGLTLDEIEARCAKRDLPIDLVYEAMELVSKRPKITTSGKKYIEKIVKKHDPFYRPSYPPMTPETDGSGIEADFSYLFLTPAEMRDYRVSLKGGYGNPRRKHPSKNT